MKEGDRIDVDFEFECPFCGLKAYLATKDYAVMHLEPMCETFARLEPDEFLEAVNKARRN